MIPKNVTMKSCVGKRAVADRDLQNYHGVITEGSEVEITGSNSYGMEIRTPPCKCCGVSLRMSHVGRSELTVLEEADNG